ncbi:MAG: SGNH/GDSL hydrolase family protein [bacterium]|nr:SGNH/GDSL hydrolase family protein [bacterium]
MRYWFPIAAAALGLLLVEGGLRVLTAVRDATPPHWDRAQRKEWSWARRHLDAGVPILPGLSTYDPDLGWVMPRRVSKNEAGASSPGAATEEEFARARTPGQLRVLFVGDSYTFGQNVDNESTFQSILEREYLPGSEMINLGVSGYGADQSVLMYEKYGQRYAADIVVLGFFDRGFYRSFTAFRDYAKPYFFLDEAGRLRLEGTPVVPPETLYQLYASGQRRVGGVLHSYLAGSILGQLDRLIKKGDVDRDSRSWKLMALILRRFQEQVKADGSTPFLLVFADRPHKCGDCVYSQISKLAEREARNMGLPVLSLREPFLEHPDEEFFNPMGAGGHYNPRGHELAARLLNDALREVLEESLRPEAELVSDRSHPPDWKSR